MSVQEAASSQYQLNRYDEWNMLVPPAVNKKEGEFKIAGLNIQTAWVTDSPTNLTKHPQYAWKNRLKPVTQLIVQDQPTILALSELHLIQIQDLRQAFQGTGYQIVGYSSETRESIEVVEEKVLQNKDYYYSEFVAFLYNSNEVDLTDLTCVELEKGEKHKRILSHSR